MIELFMTQSQVGLMPAHLRRISSELAQRQMPFRVVIATDPQTVRGYHCGPSAVVPNPAAHPFAAKKSLAMRAMEAAGRPFVPTIHLQGDSIVKVWDRLVTELGVPFVMKPEDGSLGRHVFLVHDPEGYLNARHKGCDVAQKYISSGAVDFRVTIVDGKAVAAIKRTAKPGEFRANIALGAKFEAAEVTPNMRETAEGAAAALGVDVGGIDLFRIEEDGRERFLFGEVNLGGDYLHTERATGINVYGMLADYLIKRCTP